MYVFVVCVRDKSGLELLEMKSLLLIRGKL